MSRILTSGQPVPPDNSHTEIDPVTGQQKGYVVLTAEERAKGFVRPVRQVYAHVGRIENVENAEGTIVGQQRIGGCGTTTRMGLSIAETYAREPHFYSGTFCVQCGKHLPLNEFVWEGTNEQVGS